MAGWGPTQSYSPHNPVRPRKAHHPVMQHGVAHMTPAIRQLHSIAMGVARTATRGRRKTRKPGAVASPKAARGRKRSARATSAAAKFVKGSQAARAHMAKLRKMRGSGKKKAAKAA